MIILCILFLLQKLKSQKAEILGHFRYTKIRRVRLRSPFSVADKKKLFCGDGNGRVVTIP